MDGDATKARKITCALLAGHPWDWAATVTMLCSGLDFVTLTSRCLGLREAPNPFALPTDDRAEVALVAASWYDWLRGRDPDRVREVMSRLHRHADVVVGLDGVDELALRFPPDTLDHFAIVIKPQGVYRDRELYNYEVGALHPGAVWKGKQRPRAERYSDQDLEKLRLSIPCFLLHHPAARKAARLRDGMSRSQAAARGVVDRLLSATGRIGALDRRLEVHCILTLTHVQRNEAVRLLDGFRGSQGITGVPDRIAGTEHGLAPPNDIREEAARVAGPYRRQRMGRLRYELDVRRHKVVFAPTGYGELTYRHAEAWRAGAALVCQDLSHVEMQLPITNRQNAVFCSPDLHDLRREIEGLLRDDAMRGGIARNGSRDFASWSRRWRDHLFAGIEHPVREALGA